MSNIETKAPRTALIIQITDPDAQYSLVELHTFQASIGKAQLPFEFVDVAALQKLKEFCDWWTKGKSTVVVHSLPRAKNPFDQ